MALVVADRVQETTSTTSTSDYVLLGAAAGYQSFGAVLANADTTYYAITNDTDWEVGIGTYSTTGPTLARTTILASSSGGSAVSWGVGVKNIFISYAASKSVYLDASGNLSVSDKIIHTGDTNTAIRFPAADTVSIETGGTERFKVENSTITTTVPVVLPADPTTSLQAATKSYVDTIASASIHYHTPVRVESPTPLTVTYNNGTAGVGATLTNAGAQAALALDGVTLSVNDRVLIYTQVDQTQNGVYDVTSVGSGSTNWVLTRSDDTDTYGASSPTALGAGDAFFVSQGATGAGELYVCNTTGTITFGTTNITFVQVAATAVYTAGTAISITNNVITNTAPDQTVALTQGGATTITGTYPNFTISSTDTTYTAGDGIGLAGTTFSVAAGTGLTQDADGLSHADTSSQASVDNTGATFVQDINLDGFGHVTGAASVTVTPSLIGAPSTSGVGATGTWGISISGNAANVTGTVAVANGGTGATTTSQARTNLDVPSATGGGASGTWGINVSGNAATATTLQTARNINETSFNGSASITVPRVRAVDDRTAAPADFTTGYMTVGFGSWTNNNSSPYSDYMAFRTYTDATGGNDNMLAFRKDALGMRLWQQSYGSATAFSSFKDIAWTDGTNATGTWGISISGNAANVSGTVSVSNGGTGATTAPQALTNLGAAPLADPAFTGQVSIADGSAAAPSLTNTGDLNAGLFFPAADNVAVTTAGTERLRVADAGAIGVGVTPSAWAAPAAIALEFPNGANLFSSTASVFQMGANNFYDGTYKYKTNGFASRYRQDSGTHIWDTVASGTAGNPITFVRSMTLDASGNLGIGTTSPATKLQVAGVTSSVFYENPTTITTSYTITTGSNAMAAGPITIASGVTVTIPSGSVWTIV